MDIVLIKRALGVFGKSIQIELRMKILYIFKFKFPNTSRFKVSIYADEQINNNAYFTISLRNPQHFRIFVV